MVPPVRSAVPKSPGATAFLRFSPLSFSPFLCLCLSLSLSLSLLSSHPLPFFELFPPLHSFRLSLSIALSYFSYFFLVYRLLAAPFILVRSLLHIPYAGEPRPQLPPAVRSLIRTRRRPSFVRLMDTCGETCRTHPGDGRGDTLFMASHVEDQVR